MVKLKSKLPKRFKFRVSYHTRGDKPTRGNRRWQDVFALSKKSAMSQAKKDLGKKFVIESARDISHQGI